MIQFKSKNFGFSIIEVIIAIFVITVGAVAVFGSLQSALMYNSVNSSRLTAAYLAQEGIEIVRNIRDGNWLEDVSWDNGLGQGDWEADYTSQDLTDNYDGDYLHIDGSGFYSYSGSSPTQFKRKITISDKINLDGDPENTPEVFTVTVLVEWSLRGKPYDITVQEKLYNWR